MMGHILGAGELEDAKYKAGKMRTVTVICGIVFAVLLACIAPFFPLMYNTSDNIRSLATGFILIAAALRHHFAQFLYTSTYHLAMIGNDRE